MIATDPFLAFVGRRVVVSLDGRFIHGRLISVRNGFATIETRPGHRICINKFEITFIEEETRPISRNPRLSKTFWR